MILSGFQEEHQLLDWYEQDSISALQYICLLYTSDAADE